MDRLTILFGNILCFGSSGQTGNHLHLKAVHIDILKSVGGLGGFGFGSCCLGLRLGRNGGICICALISGSQ